MRFPSYPSLERTAVMAFNASVPYTPPAGTSEVLLFRQPVWPLWGRADPSVAAGAATYGISYGMTAISKIGTTVEEGVYSEAADIDAWWFQNTTSGSGVPSITNAGGSWPFSSPVIGVDRDDIAFVWVPGNSYLMLSMGALPVAYEARVTLEAWASPGDVRIYSTATLVTASTLTSTGITIPISFNTWIRIKSVSISFPAGAGMVAVQPTLCLGVGLTTAPPVYTPSATFGSWNVAGIPGSRSLLVPIAQSAEFNNSNLPWRATRLTATAALFTNTTKVLNKEGTVLWGRINPNTTSPFRTSLSTIETLHPAEKAYLDLEQGCYAYNPPSTDLANFYDYVQSFATATSIPRFRLDNEAMVCVAYFTDPDGGTNLAVNMDWAIEFRTSSTLFQIGVSSLPLETLHSAQIALLKAGFFYNNVDHTAIIRAVISGLASLHPLLRVAAPLAHGLMGASSVAVNSRVTQKNRPKATSGSRSGITLPPRNSRRAKQRGGTRAQSRPRSTVRRSKATVNRALDAMDRVMARQGRPARGARA